ncbi:MAG: hypothetical protein IJW70_02200 [Clostridia bacterium]|nr:hypothetical protein [Clostridia bacterium]
MKIKWIALVLACVMSVLCLCSCGGAKIAYDQEDGSYTDKRGNTYLRAPSCYEPVSYDSEKVYGTLTAGIGTFDLYSIAGTEKGEWLTTAEKDVLYKDSVALPTLQDFGTNCIYVCREGESIHAFARIDTAAEINALVKAYLEGESIPYPSRQATQSLRLRFASEKYPFLYYRLTYLEYSSDVIVYDTDENGQEIEINYGKYFIYNRDDGRCVPVGDAVHKYVE